LVHRLNKKPIEPLTPEEVEKLQATAGRPEFRDMRFSLSLMLYGGIRPTVAWQRAAVITKNLHKGCILILL